MGGWMDGWMDGWVDGRTRLRIAYSNQKDQNYVDGMENGCNGCLLMF